MQHKYNNENKVNHSVEKEHFLAKIMLQILITGIRK